MTQFVLRPPSLPANGSTWLAKQSVFGDFDWNLRPPDILQGRMETLETWQGQKCRRELNMFNLIFFSARLYSKMLFYHPQIWQEDLYHLQYINKAMRPSQKWGKISQDAQASLIKNLFGRPWGNSIKFRLSPADSPNQVKVGSHIPFSHKRKMTRARPHCDWGRSYTHEHTYMCMCVYRHYEVHWSEESVLNCFDVLSTNIVNHFDNILS